MPTRSSSSRTGGSSSGAGTRSSRGWAATTRRCSGTRRGRPVARNKYDVDEELSQELDARAVLRMLGYLRPHGRRVLAAVSLMVVASLLSLIGPYIAKVAIDDCIPRKDIGLLAVLAAILVAAQALNALFLRIRIQVMNDIG